LLANDIPTPYSIFYSVSDFDFYDKEKQKMDSLINLGIRLLCGTKKYRISAVKYYTAEMQTNEFKANSVTSPLYGFLS
jgi:hypothetical protein